MVRPVSQQRFAPAGGGPLPPGGPVGGPAAPLAPGASGPGNTDDDDVGGATAEPGPAAEELSEADDALL